MFYRVSFFSLSTQTWEVVMKCFTTKRAAVGYARRLAGAAYVGETRVYRGEVGGERVY